jgi:phosphate starvation-inducible PhoH-like protein
MHSKDYPANSKKKRAKVESITDYRHQKEFFKEPESTKYTVLHPRNITQRKYLESMRDNILTIGIGVPGGGKTTLAFNYGVQLLDKGKIDKIYYLKPNVGCSWEKGIGFVSGKAKEKIGSTLLMPVKTNLLSFMSPETLQGYLDRNEIEGTLFEYIRGITFENCMAILDEAQNVPPEAVKTFLTRLGQNTKLIICGDPNQKDVNLPTNGLIDVMKKLENLPNVGVVRFSREDIVRHPMIKMFLERYED